MVEWLRRSPGSGSYKTVERPHPGMDRETLVTGGSTAGVIVGSAVLIAGVEFGSLAVQGVGGALALAGTLALAAYLAGLEDEGGAAH